MNNPYSWNTVNPDMFFGRNDLLTELLSGLPGSSRISYGVSGGRRMGKSTLLRKIEKEISDSISQWKSGGLTIVPIYVDGLALPRPLSYSYIWSYIYLEMIAQLPQSYDKKVVNDFNEFKSFVGPILKEQQDRVRVIVFFDEVEPILVNEWADSFFANWRALLSNTPDLSEYFVAVFSGAREMAALQRDIGSPLKDILEWFNLRSFDYEDACKLMQEPLAIKWDVSFLEKAYLLSGGHPMLIQYLMHSVIQNDPPLPIEYLDYAALQFEKKRKWQFSEWWYRNLTPLAQRIYSRVAEPDLPVSKRDITKEFGVQNANEALEILQHVGLVFEEEDGFLYRYAGEMFKSWYKKYATLPEFYNHDPEIYDRLNRIDNKIADKYLSAWRIYQGEMPNYSGAIAEIRGVLESLVEYFAPNSKVMSEEDFKLETNMNRPTRRQKLRYILKARYSTDKIKEVISDYSLFEMQCDQLAVSTNIAYGTSSSYVHETVGREMAYRTLKQWDALIVQILPNDVDMI